MFYPPSLLHSLLFSLIICVLQASAAYLPGAAPARRETPPAPSLTPSPTVIERGQIPFNFCPEQLGNPKKRCDDPSCGGDTKDAGFCDNILLSGPQGKALHRTFSGNIVLISEDNCFPAGCGVRCQCTPTKGETPIPTGQIPFQICPEALGKPKKKCSDCGGDSKQNGVCDKILLSGDQTGCLPSGCGYFCQCDSDSSSTPPSGHTTTITTVVSGQTVTATFEPTTLSDLTKLRQSATVTTTVDGKETALAVFAGGVAWWLLGKLNLRSRASQFRC